jgi:vacuole morphology and inheritance protein 14
MSKNDLFPPQLARNLSDRCIYHSHVFSLSRSYEKRKMAALEVERMLKSMLPPDSSDDSPAKSGKFDRCRQLIQAVHKDFIESTQANQRKGGLIVMAQAAIALAPQIEHFLDLLLPPVVSLFKDQESRVRYYACEALYNICKIARAFSLRYFNQIFNGLCFLFKDVDVDVKNGAQLLDRLMKDIVSASDEFQIALFIPLLRERLADDNPYNRQLILGWIALLYSVPDIDVISYLPQYLGGLFDMLSDPQKDIRQQADFVLSELLKEIRTLKTGGRQGAGAAAASPSQNRAEPSSPTVPVSFGPMVEILVNQCTSSEKPPINRLTGLTWLYDFIDLGKTELLPFYALILGAVLHCISSDREDVIRDQAQKTNAALLELVKHTPAAIPTAHLLGHIRAHLRSDHVPTRLASLTWISMLLSKVPEDMYSSLDGILPALLGTLSDRDDSVVEMDLEVLSRICTNPDFFESVLERVLALFRADGRLLEIRGNLIIQRLSTLIDGERIFIAVARILAQEKDVEFVSLMVQTLNLILLTSADLFGLREKLKESLLTRKGQELFTVIFQTWCFFSFVF